MTGSIGNLKKALRWLPVKNKPMDTASNLWENDHVNMSNKARHTKNFVYPESTAGSKAAKRLRTEANKLSGQDRESLFKRGMQIIYGATAPPN
jgi:hypothetical protein